jgi:sodium/proline symporter
MAMNPGNTILGLVAYAWGGLGAAFGPVVLCALFSRRTTWVSALAGMVAGTVALVVWKQTGLDATMYEIVPGFAANLLTILAVDCNLPQRNEAILGTFDAMRRRLRG